MANDNILAPFQPKNHDHGKCVAEAIAVAEARCVRERVQLHAVTPTGAGAGVVESRAGGRL